MSPRFSLGRQLVCCVLLLVCPISNAFARIPTESQTVVFMPPKHPVVIQLNVYRGDQAFEDFWSQTIAQHFQKADKNGDGFLSKEEIAPAPKPKPKRPLNAAAIAEKSRPRKKPNAKPSNPLQKISTLWQADADPQDERLSFDEVTWFLSRSNRGAFDIGSNSRGGSIRGTKSTGNDNAGTRLWEWLDGDANKRLSHRELSSAQTTLKKYDLDADETISLMELESNVNPFFNAQSGLQFEEMPFFVVGREQSTTQLVQKLLERYRDSKSSGQTVPPPRTSSEKNPIGPPPGKGVKPIMRPRGVPVEIFNIPESDQPQYDRDGNGFLDLWELHAYLQHPVPDVVLTVRFSKDPKEQPQITAKTMKKKSSIIVKTSLPGTISLMIGDRQLEWDVHGLQPQGLMKSVEQRFENIDFDKNGYLTEQESRRDPYFRTSFTESDLDGDGKLFPEEWKPIVEAALKFAQARTRMTVHSSGRDVFKILDANQDGKIGPREWLTAAQRMKLWDRNQNNNLEKNEIPSVYQVSIGPGLPRITGLVQPESRPQGASKTRGLVRGPKWFIAMDKNEDGDVSRNEFLGTPNAFTELDRDQNELIDADEASVFSKATRSQ